MGTCCYRVRAAYEEGSRYVRVFVAEGQGNPSKAKCLARACFYSRLSAIGCRVPRSKGAGRFWTLLLGGTSVRRPSPGEACRGPRACLCVSLARIGRCAFSGGCFVFSRGSDCTCADRSFSLDFVIIRRVPKSIVIINQLTQID